MSRRTPPWQRSLFVLAIILAVGGTTALGTSRMWPWPINLSAAPGASRQPEAAFDPATGDLIVVWEDHGIAQREEIVGRRWDRLSSSWLPLENLSQSDWQDGGPALLFDGLGHGHLLWTRRYAAIQGAPTDGTDLMWRYWDGAEWLPEETLLHVDSYLPGTYGLVLTESPGAVLLFLVWNGGFRQAKFERGDWSDLTPWDYRLNMQFAQALVDEEGKLHVAGYGPNSSDLAPWFYDAYYTSYDGTEWREPLNLSFTDGVASAVGMAFDKRGDLHFLWSDPGSLYSPESPKSAIWERIYDGNGWSSNAEITDYNPDQAINSFSLAADISSTLHLGWSEGIMNGGAHTGLDVYYRMGDGTSWAPEEMVYTSTTESRYPVLAIDPESSSLIWEEGPLRDQDIFFSRQVHIPPGLCRSISDVNIIGPRAGTVGAAYAFAALASPPTASLSITYTWQASEQSLSVHPSGLVDWEELTWYLAGTKAITVTAKNCGEAVSATHTIELKALDRVYLPLITKD